MPVPGSDGVRRVALAAAGAAVVVNDIDAAGADETVELIGRRWRDGARPLRRHQPDGRRHAPPSPAPSRSFGGLDIVHANAGVERYVDLEKMSDEDMALLLDVDLKGVLLCFREAIPPLRARGGGTLIATSSVQASHSLPGCVVYAAAKAAVIAAVRTLALEVGRDNIRVVADLAGHHRHRHAPPRPRRHERRRGGGLSPARARRQYAWPHRHDRGDRRRRRLPRRSGAAYITGTNIVIDGGFTAVKTF